MEVALQENMPPKFCEFSDIAFAKNNQKQEKLRSPIVAVLDHIKHDLCDSPELTFR